METLFFLLPFRTTFSSVVEVGKTNTPTNNVCSQDQKYVYKQCIQIIQVTTQNSIKKWLGLNLDWGLGVVSYLFQNRNIKFSAPKVIVKVMVTYESPKVNEIALN